MNNTIPSLYQKSLPQLLFDKNIKNKVKNYFLSMSHLQYYNLIGEDSINLLR